MICGGLLIVGFLTEIIIAYIFDNDNDDNNDNDDIDNVEDKG